MRMSFLKKIILFSVFLFSVSNLLADKKPQYVFYFIGDGMGINQVEATNFFISKDIKDVNNKLLMTQFPYTGYATTYSASHYITCSAAGGTALATGSKTANNSIGMDENRNPLRSVLLKMQDEGWKTGVVTTEGLNDATPAAFYAHRYRRESTEIALDAADSGIDFFGGCAFLTPKNKKDPTDSILNKFKNNGYEILKGKDTYKTSTKLSKILMIPEKKYPLALPYSIDREPDDMKLLDLTSSAIDFLQKDNDKGFFLMIEGGEIDHASHLNDLGTVVREVIDLDENINLAYQFYLKHPDETLILVSADHETGGLGLGTKYTSLNIQALQHQKVSVNRLSSLIRELRKNDSITWEDLKDTLSKQLGFWNEITLSVDDEMKLKKCFEDTFINKNNATVNTLYAKDEPLAVEAIAVLNRICEVGWTTNSHTAGVVPIYAIGVGAENFTGRMDNTDIPNRLLNLIKNQK